MKNTTLLRLTGAGLLASNDQMQFSVRELVVPGDCGEVEVTLRHSGQMSARAMGHDWVLAKDSDMSGIVNAGPCHGDARRVQIR